MPREPSGATGSSFDWSGHAASGASRTFRVSVQDDEDFEEAERF